MSDSATLHVAFWNTWLLRPRLWRDGPPVPGGDRFFAPDVLRRSPLVGAAIRDRFDVAALAEVFETSEQRSVAAAVPHSRSVPGPAAEGWRFTGSGLFTIVDERRVQITETVTMRFRSGGDLRDADTMATKGALLVRLRIGPDLPELDLVSTHLFAGGEFIPFPGAGWRGRHHRVRRAQIEELASFVADHRRPSNPLLLVGDFNVAAYDSDPNLGDTAARYDEMRKILAPLDIVDLWEESGVGPGPTSTFTEPADLPADPADPALVADDADARPDTTRGDRIDHLFLGQPQDGSVTVRAERPRRWAFPGRDAHGGPAGSLSDHLCLSTVLHVGR